MLSELRDLGDRFYKATNFHINSFGGEGAIRTLQPRLASASYSVVVAASATFAIIAVAHCPKVPKSIAVWRQTTQWPGTLSRRSKTARIFDQFAASSVSAATSEGID